MKALVFYGPGNFRLEEKPKPEIGDGEILLKVIACGFCGTDFKILNFGHRAVKTPMVIGHEIVGRVVESKVPKADAKVGSRVIVVTPGGCGKGQAARKVRIAVSTTPPY
jgi:L-iditol 2-dehydrogenase